MICDYLACNCVDFASMMASSLGKQGMWVPYKHLYYILQYAMYFGLVNHLSIIHPRGKLGYIIIRLLLNMIVMGSVFLEFILLQK
jgi:hypothetical protein